MIHSTPIVAARTTDKTMLSRRGVDGTGTAVSSGAPYVNPATLATGGGGVTRLTVTRIAEHSTNNSAAKCRKLIPASQDHTVSLGRYAFPNSSTSRAVPSTKPVQSAANA